MTMNLKIRTVYAHTLVVGNVLIDGYTITQVELRGKTIHLVGQSDDGKSVKSHSFRYYEEVAIFIGDK